MGLSLGKMGNWIGYIPTWQSPVVWVVVALLLVWWNWPHIKTGIKNRSRSAPTLSDPQGSSGSAYDRLDPNEDLHNDERFDFKWWKWKEPSNSRDLAKSKKSKRTRYTDALDLFELSEPFTMAELKKAYAKLVKETHPDSGGNPALFRQVKKAFELLKTRAK